MKILITGASGFVGRYVVLEALRRGHAVKAVVRPSSVLKGLPWIKDESIEMVFTDLRFKQKLLDIMSDVDEVIHLALSKEKDFYAALYGTLVGTENLLDAMLYNKINRILLVSSFAVYNYSKMKKHSLLSEECPIENEPEKRRRK